MYELYWEKMSGAVGPQALLEEMGLPCRLIPVDMAAGAHKAPEYLAVNPVARVPALRLPDGEVIGETGAMTVLLGERHPEAGLVPEPGAPDRPAFLFWLFYMASVGYPTFSRAWHPEQFTPEPAAHDGIAKVAEADLDRLFAALEGAVAGDPFFLPRGFTALDIYLDMLTRWAPDRPKLLREHPRIFEICAALDARPACRRVFDSHFAE